MNRIAWILGIALAASSCRNSCQDLCYDMADFLEKECGITVNDADIQTCVDEQAGVDATDRAACRQFDGAKQIEEEWGCEELEGYFAASE